MADILIVEDESLVAMDLTYCVESLGHNVVDVTSDSTRAIQSAKLYTPDLILMDICIKGKFDGIQTAELILQDLKTKIIYITAISSKEDIKRAAKTNPSSYILKPFTTKSIQAAVEIALCKNNKNELKGDIILDEEFSYDTKTKELICCGKYIKLTKRERELLSLFINSANKIISIYDIENSIWPDKEFNINTTRALICRLRAKLKNKIIETIPSIGYRIIIN